MTLSKHGATETLALAARTALEGFFEADLAASPGMQHLADALDDYDDAVEAERKALQQTTRVLNMHLGRIFSRLDVRSVSPSYRYWELRGVRYCYNTRPLTDDETGGKWFTWEYRPVRGKAGQLELQHKVRCSTHTKAKAKAYARFSAAKAATFKGATA